MCSSDLVAANRALKEAGKEEAAGDSLVLGITEVAINRKSFLSAASFQHTTRTLIGAALRGTTDNLKGLKENVIIGRLIPSGTGFVGSQKHELISEFQAERAQRREEELSREDDR